MDRACGSAIAEIELGHFALKRSTNEQVRALTRRLMDEDARMIRRLNRASNCGDLALKGATDPLHRFKPTGKLKHLSGAEFDREYLEKVIKDHRARIDYFESEAHKVARQLPRDAAGRPTARNSPTNVVQDADMAQRQGEAVFAREMLPSLRERLAEAERIREELQGE